MQVRSMVAVDQFWVYDSKYLPVVFGMMAVWGLLLARRIRTCGVRAAARRSRFTSARSPRREFCWCRPGF